MLTGHGPDPDLSLTNPDPALMGLISSSLILCAPSELNRFYNCLFQILPFFSLIEKY